MKLLCIGKTGQIARALAELSATGKIDCVCLGRPSVDLESARSLETAINQVSPDLVINAAAYTNVDQAESEPDRAMALNGAGAGALALACRDAAIPLIHISTDYVFSDPTDRPLKETDPVNAANAYGRTKAAGEIAVRQGTDSHIVLRTSWVYSPFGSNFVKTMLRIAKQHGVAKVVDDQVGSPTSALDIAQVILNLAPKLLGSNSDHLFGTYHFAASGYASWADLAAFVFKLYEAKTGRKSDLIRIPSSGYSAQAARPLNSRLDTTKITRAFGIHPRNWEDGVVETVDRLLFNE